MKSFLIVAIVSLFSFSAHPTTAAPKDDAAAALALAKSKAQRTQPTAKREAIPVPAVKCFTDLAAAQAEAKRTGKPLVVWVAMVCSDCPEVCEKLRDCVSCHQASFNGSATPRLCVPTDGGNWCFPKSQLGTVYDASSVRAILGKPIPSEQRRVIQPLQSSYRIDDYCPASA